MFLNSVGKPPYIEIDKISFWIENCDVSVSSLAFKNTIPAYTYILGKNSITTSAYGTDIVPECADHVTYDYTVRKKSIDQNVYTLLNYNPWLTHKKNEKTFTIYSTIPTDVGDY